MRKKDETKKTKIQEAVAAIILSEGAGAVSTVKVAKRVGISQSNVYLYFKNKEALLLSVYQRELAQIQTSGDIAKLNDHALPVADRIRLYVQSVFDYSMAHPTSLTLIQQIKYLMGQFDESPFTQSDQVTDHTVTNLLDEAVKADVIKPLPVNVYMSLVFSTIHTHTLNVARGDYPAAQYAFEDIFALLWDAMRS